MEGQSSLEGLDVRWRGKRFYADAATPPTPVHDDFKTNYAKRRGFATPNGHILWFDDTEGSEEINLVWVNAAGVKTKLIVDKDGTVKLTVLDAKHNFTLDGKTKKCQIDLDENKHKITLDATAKKMEVSLENGAQKMTLDNATPKLEVALANGQHKMTLNGTMMEVQLGGGATLKAEQNAANATLTVGDGSKHVAIVEALKDFYNNDIKPTLDDLKSALNEHTHDVPSSGFNATAPGAPIAGQGTASANSSAFTGTIPSWDDSIESSKVAIPDG